MCSWLTPNLDLNFASISQETFSMKFLDQGIVGIKTYDS